MWRLLMPETYGSEYMTAMAVGPPFEILDSQTGYPFLPNQNSSEIETSDRRYCCLLNTEN